MGVYKASKKQIFIHKIIETVHTQNKVNTVFIFEAFFHTNNWFLVTNETVIIITLFLQTRNAAWVGIFFVWVV